MRPSITEITRGRWRGILSAVGVDDKSLSGKHGSCPLCGGKDRFRFDDKEGRGTWICSHCGAGDGLKLVMGKTGADFRGAVEQIERLAGAAPRVDLKPERSDADKRGAMNTIWRASSPVQAGDPVALWLSRRVGLATFPACLRSHRWVRYQDDVVTHHPAMIAMVCRPDGRPATLHRTYLTKLGEKAVVDAPRRLMSGGLPPGSAVRLFPAETTLGVAEGIETAFAAASLFGVPVWAAINAGNLAEWVPPPEVRDVVVFGDNDASCTGQAAAFTLARRLIASDRSARVEIPPVVGEDWNDVLLRREVAA